MIPFKFEEIQINQSTIYTCSFESFSPLDYSNYLSSTEQEQLFSFKSESRRMEYVASRILRHRIFGFQHIRYNQNGAPYIEGKGFISISHCHNIAGIAINKDFKVGLDLEAPRENIHELKHKFLSEHEKQVFDTTNKLEVTKIWSAKEALYKMAGRKKIIFSTELLLDKDQDGNWSGTIINDDHDLSVKLNIFEHEGIIFSINKEQIVKLKRNT